MSSPLKAVLFDLDGTLINSAPLWYEVEDDYVTDNGGRWTPELAAVLHGQPFDWCVAQMMKAAGIKGKVKPVARELTNEMATLILTSGAPWLPGVKKLLKELRKSPIKVALVSNSFQSYVQAVADAAPEGTFDVVVSGDQVKTGKPAPDSYLLAAKQLGVDPSKCLVVEDSEPGVIAGQSAGMTVLAVPVGAPIEPMRYDAIRESLSGVTIADLEKIVAGKKK